jgi:uncharacterized protein YndB with AHSA1/START domain
MKITVQVEVLAPLDTVWDAYNTPDDITKWNFASDEWCCPKATLDLREGGSFNFRMEAKDGSAGFDFAGTYSKVVDKENMEYALGDRVVSVEFSETPSGTKVIGIFDADTENSAEQQRHGWQCILDNFKKHVESKI